MSKPKTLSDKAKQIEERIKARTAKDNQRLELLRARIAYEQLRDKAKAKK